MAKPPVVAARTVANKGGRLQQWSLRGTYLRAPTGTVPVSGLVDQVAARGHVAYPQGRSPKGSGGRPRAAAAAYARAVTAGRG
ncbi:hypothetical protein BHM03_00052757 [Ensete ventricosum]|nr:hypothetical protein BHM03_00052757 [Ensete ventricosum]